MSTILLAVSALIGIAATYPYIRDTMRGEVKPQLVTWSIWTVLGAVMTIAAISQQQVASAVLSSIALIDCGAVVAFGWRYGDRKIHRTDYYFLAGAALGIAALFVFRIPVLSLLIAVTVDALAFIPTIVHAWTKPHEESLTSYGFSAVAALIVLVTTFMDHSNLLGFLYPGYSLIFNGAMVSILAWHLLRRESEVVDTLYSVENA